MPPADVAPSGERAPGGPRTDVPTTCGAAAVDPLAPSSLRAATLLLHMRALVDNRDFDRESALHAAAALCNPPVVRLLLQSMSDANLRSRFGAAPLHCAAHGGDASVVSLLLETAMDLDAQAHDGSTPILLASEGNHVMVADRSAPPPFMGLLGSSWIRSASGVAGAAAPAAERRGRIYEHPDHRLPFKDGGERGSSVLAREASTCPRPTD